MDVRVDGKKGVVVGGVDPVLAQVQDRLRRDPKQWLALLQQDPGKFADIEKDVHRAFVQMADQVVAGLLAEATSNADFALDAKKKVVEAREAREARDCVDAQQAAAGKRQRLPKLRSGERRPLRLRLLGGLVLWVTTLYCGPTRRTGKKRGPEGSGVYPGVPGVERAGHSRR
jgi:hypothetical protein